MNVLIVKPSSLGDIIHALPAVDLIRRHHPDAFIAWVVNDSYIDLLRLYPGVNQIIPFKRKRWGKLRHWHELLPFARTLRAARFDVAIDLQGLLRSGLIVRASAAPDRVGFSHAREGAHRFYTRRIDIPQELRHAVDKNTALVRAAFALDAEARFPPLSGGQDSVDRAQALLAEHGLSDCDHLLVAAPCSRWESKMWPSAFFVDVLTQVSRRTSSVGCWLLGTQEEHAAAEAVAAACSGCRVVNLAGKTNLPVLTELLKRSRAMLTNDSGPMHLAAALGVPTVALFGATDPELTGPHGDQHVVFRGECEISPCFERCCPLEDRACSAAVQPEAVADAVVRMLERPDTDGTTSSRGDL